MSRRRVFLVSDDRVGSTFINDLLQSVKADELVTCNIAKKTAEGDASGLEDLAPLVGQCIIKSGDYSDAKDADIVVITTGVARKLGMARSDLVDTNVKTLESIVRPIVDFDFNDISVVSANSVDILTTSTQELPGFPKNRVIGTGTPPDTARLCVTLLHKTGMNVDHIDTYVLGEHGDTSLENSDETTIDHEPLCSYKELDEQILAELEADVRKKGDKIIASKGATFYGAVMCLTQICKAALGNTVRIASLPAPMTGEYGVYDLYLESPAVVITNEISDVIELHLSEDEKKKMTYSATKVGKVVDGINL